MKAPAPMAAPWVAPETIGDGIQRLLDLARLVGVDVSGFDSAVTPERCASEDWTSTTGRAWSSRVRATLSATEATSPAARSARSVLCNLGSAGHSFGIHLDKVRAPPEELWFTESGVAFSLMSLIAPQMTSPLVEFEEALEEAEEAAKVLRPAPIEDRKIA